MVCFGNVLLDRVIKLEDPELLKRYELELGAKGEMDLEKLNAIITDAANGWVLTGTPHMLITR